MATFTATAEPLNVPPRVRLDISAFTGSTVGHVTRIDAAGGVAKVRAGDPVALTSGAAVLYDYEAKFGQAFTYTIYTDAGVGLNGMTSNSVTLAVYTPWLLHPGVPNLSQKVTISSMGDQTLDATRGVHTVLGRADPIVITDGVRRSPTFDLTLRTKSDAAEAGLLTLLQDGSPLLLQATYGTMKGTSYNWVSVGAVTRVDMVPFFDNTDVQWTLPCTVTSAPAGLLQTQRTWGDLLAEYPSTWRQVTSAYATWRGALTGP